MIALLFPPAAEEQLVAMQGKVVGLHQANTVLTEQVLEAVHSHHAVEADSLAMAIGMGYY
jgi:hypothetical protein